MSEDALVPTGSGLLLTVAEADAVRGYALAEKSEATRRGYRSDFAGFSRWCTDRQVEPLPASPRPRGRPPPCSPPPIHPRPIHPGLGPATP